VGVCAATMNANVAKIRTFSPDACRFEAPSFVRADIDVLRRVP
jgi:hypothetical protein